MSGLRLRATQAAPALTARDVRSSLRATQAAPALRATPTSFRLLPWHLTWDLSEPFPMSSAAWTYGGRVGGIDLGPAALAGEVWLTAWLSPLSDSTGGAFLLTGGTEEAQEELSPNSYTGNPQALDASAWEMGEAQLLDVAGRPLAALTVSAAGAQWSIPMPARADVGLAAGAYAVIWLQARPQRSEQAAGLLSWGRFTRDYWVANGSPEEVAGYDAWAAAYAAEVAWNATAPVVSFFFLVTTPSA